MGMNTSAIFNPTHWKEQKLRESKDLGLTRVEISYYAHSVEEE